MPLKDILFGFRGRIRRRDWWLWGIASGIGWAVIYGAAIVLWTSNAWLLDEPLGAAGPSTLIVLEAVTYLPLLWIQSALAAKRAHDRDRRAAVAVGLTLLSGVLSFAPGIIDIVAGFSLRSDSLFGALDTTASVATFVVALYLLITLGIMDGTPGPNRFGRSPKGIGGDLPDQTAKVFS